MNITIAPLRIDSHNASKLLPVRDEGEYLTPVYLGIYLNNVCPTHQAKIWLKRQRYG